MSRPPLEDKLEIARDINWKLIENLCQIQCTQEEIEAVIGVNLETLVTHCKKVHGVSFSVFYKEKKKTGQVSLRRAQWLNATKKENTVMQIFLGKQYLGQSDKNEVESKMQPIKIEFKDASNRAIEAPEEVS